MASRDCAQGQPYGTGRPDGRMLHRNVKVRYERLARIAQILEHFVRHPGGVKIHEAQAFEARQWQEAVEQCAEILLAVEITAPFREILRHEIQFLDP